MRCTSFPDRPDADGPGTADPGGVELRIHGYPVWRFPRLAISKHWWAGHGPDVLGLRWVGYQQVAEQWQ